MSEALTALSVPVVSGNVSLYNESASRAIYPTPVVGMMGLLERSEASVGHGFVAAGDLVVLAGDDGVLDASEYAGGARGRPPEVNVEREAGTIELVLAAAEEGILRSAHDVSGGGLAVALAESAIAGGLGAAVELAPGRRDDEALFGEGGGRVVMTVLPEHEGRLRALAGERDVRVVAVGAVGGEEVVARVGGREARLPLAEAREAHEHGLPEALG
jgi:phosphoribosylformylglycinamidine synthase